MKRGGFSLVEIIITVAILGILLTLGVVSMVNSQVSSRDKERQAEVESIAIYLEDFYKNQTSGPDGIYRQHSGGTYPDTKTITLDSSNFSKVFPDIKKSTLRSPGVKDSDPMSLVAATSASTQTPTTAQYIYQPLTKDGTLCADIIAQDTPCVKFNLTYRSEQHNSVQTVKSKNQ